VDDSYSQIWMVRGTRILTGIRGGRMA